MHKLSKPVWAIDESRVVNGKPLTKRFTSLAWKLMAGDDNLKAGRWKRIAGPKPVAAVKLQEKTPKIDATRTAIDLARQKGVNILNVPGSGDGGRILKADVEEYLIRQGKTNEEEE